MTDDHQDVPAPAIFLRTQPGEFSAGPVAGGPLGQSDSFTCSEVPMSDTTETSASPLDASFQHDHAWRLHRDPRRQLRDPWFKIYKCDLCPATWAM